MATPVQHKEVKQLIQQLDGSGGDTAVAVIPLTEFEPLALNSHPAIHVRDRWRSDPLD